MALVRRRRLVAVLLLVSVIVTVGGVGAARYVRSPEQALADIGPPAAAPILEPVQQRVLTETVTLRGQVAPEGSAGINVNALTSAITAGEESGATAVVTAVPVEEGQQVAPGDVVLELSGRPVILLQGTVPLYRDLQPGDSGDDVEQLQQSLTAVGYDVASDGEYGAATADAVESLYADRGYEVPTVGDPLAVAEARRAVQTAEYAVDDAESALAEAVDVDAAEPEIELAERAQESAELDLDLARERLQELEETTGPALLRSEILLVPGAAVRVDRVGVEVGFAPGTGDPEGPLAPEQQEPDAPDGTLSFSWGQLTATALVTSEHRPLLQPDMVVEVADELGGWSGSGRVAAIADEPTADGATTGFPVTVVADDGEFPPELARTGIRITVSSAQTEEPVLVVPFAALAGGPGGEAVVDRVRGDARVTVPVTVGAQGDGFVEVTPRTPGDLQEGDSVVVGVTATTGPVGP